MSNHSKTAREAYKVIYGTTHSFESADVIYVDAREAGKTAKWNEDPQMRLLSQTDGGTVVNELINRGEMSPAERYNVTKAATAKILFLAEGRVEVVLSDEKPRENFLHHELGIILANERVQELNGIPRATLGALYAADPHPDKITALPVILDSLRIRGLANEPRPDTSTEKPEELQVLEATIQELVGERLGTLTKKIQVAQGEANRAVLSWNSFEAEKEALGWKENLPLIKLRRFFEKKAKRGVLLKSRQKLNKLEAERDLEEVSLLSGKYSPHIESVLKREGFITTGAYGEYTKEIVAETIERVILDHRAEAERPASAQKETTRPKQKPRV